MKYVVVSFFAIIFCPVSVGADESVKVTISEEDRKLGQNAIELSKLQFERNLDELLSRRAVSRTYANSFRKCMHAYYADLRQVLETEGLDRMRKIAEENQDPKQVGRLRKYPECSFLFR